MKFRIIATVVVVAILVLLAIIVENGSHTSSTPMQDNGGITLN